MSSDVTTREQRLAWSPEHALSMIDRSGGADSATAALAMMEQLVRAGVPSDALGLCILYWSRALDGLQPGPVPHDRLCRLDEDLAIERGASEVLARWLDALRRRANRAEDLDAIIRFLMQVHSMWTAPSSA